MNILKPINYNLPLFVSFSTKSKSNNYEDVITILSDKLVTLEKELPKIEWLGTTKELYDLFFALYQKHWIEGLALGLIEKYFTQSENIRSMDLSKVITFKDIKANPKVNAKPE